MAATAGPFLAILDTKYTSGDQMLAGIAKTQIYFELSFTQQDHVTSDDSFDEIRLEEFITHTIRKTNKIASQISYKMVVDALIHLTDLLCYNSAVANKGNLL